jgi:hypothetical protein
VGDDETRDGELRERGVDRPLVLEVEVRSALVQDQDPGAAVERPRGVIDPLEYLGIRPESSVDEAMSRTRSSSGMVAMGRYDASGVEAEFEPGSRRRVLRNHLGIRRARDMEFAESRALRVAQLAFIERFGPEHRFTAHQLADSTFKSPALALLAAEGCLNSPFRGFR